MDRYRKRYLAVDRQDFDQAQEILDKYYDRGDIENVSVEFDRSCPLVLIGLECSTDDYLLIAKELGIEVK